MTAVVQRRDAVAALALAGAVRIPLQWPAFQLWLADLGIEPPAPLLAALSPAERDRGARFVFERDRRRYAAAHATLRCLLASHLDVAPGALEFEAGEFGKPRLRHAACAFNLSHCDDAGVVLIASGGDIGVDVEALRPMADALELAQRNFSREENVALRRTGARQRDAAFLTGWTRKEACLKAIGSGLSISPATFTAGLAHETCRTSVPTPDGLAEVVVESRCHEGRLLLAWARVVSAPRAG